ncbi:hypothetical protein H1N96_gp01 [Escherichia phage PGN590]|uniref:Uncharacterized protein n=1 Tax=Escherichia phage PGN590 TaxID=2714735 RepID=A0A6M9EI49_9CAUD|nr:hypothetical protein H1N96_gp01 [Escherichia phage PGN590]QKL16924.1 hypothetical protein [Escherichia phage PGN590]
MPFITSSTYFPRFSTSAFIASPHFLAWRFAALNCASFIPNITDLYPSTSCTFRNSALLFQYRRYLMPPPASVRTIATVLCSYPLNHLTLKMPRQNASCSLYEAFNFN